MLPLCLSLLLYQNSKYTSMDSQPATPTLKIRLKDTHSKNKLIRHNALTYLAISDKIESSFALPKHRHYKLFYLDRDEEEIVINNQEDYSVFLNSKVTATLHLESTSDTNLDFRVRREGSGKQEKIRQIDEKIKSVRVQLQQFKRDLETKAQQFTNEKLEQIKAEHERTIQQQHREERKRNAGNFQHSVGCRSALETCQQKEAIRGLRHHCLLCAIDFCESCAAQQFRVTASQDHCPDHPLAQFRSAHWDHEITVGIKQWGQELGQTEVSGLG